MVEESDLRDKIVNLCYSFDFIENQEYIVNFIFFTWRTKQGMDISDVRLELIELILFFRQSQNKIKLEGLANNNYGDIVKGQVLRKIIISDYVISKIENWLNTFLYEETGEKYEHLGIESKDQVDWGYYDRYSDSELQQLLEIEKYRKAQRDLYSPKNKNPYFGSILYFWYDKLCKIESLQKDNGVSERKKYKFLYECMVLIGEFENDDSGLETDKSTRVRDCIKAYKKRVGIYK
ncbi:hypothetical protein HZQ19_02160 [Elizabethkingia anophelis]|uniref:hypothetical protein n=1 Tax=Elizabethkingia anophelis TaxID=1117645 RepID=UPI0021A3FE6B|nr:hypothetical protein [Elizabethkingia anophelis]MCT4014692.1 hypothetical protein [Elizabethkingia anophelis]MCT4018253.1 hypothetical protein [Elizabethkingia anophelis]